MVTSDNKYFATDARIGTEIFLLPWIVPAQTIFHFDFSPRFRYSMLIISI